MSRSSLTSVGRTTTHANASVESCATGRTLRVMTDRTTEVSEAFDRARDWDRAARDLRIDADIDRLSRLTSALAPGPGDVAVAGEATWT